jgi:hypothetical protein
MRRTYQPRGTRKEEVEIPIPVSLLQKVRAQAKERELSLNLAIVQALEAVYGEKKGEQSV